MRSFIAKRIITKYLSAFALFGHIIDLCIIFTGFKRQRWNVEIVCYELATEASHEGRHWTQHQWSHLK